MSQPIYTKKICTSTRDQSPNEPEYVDRARARGFSHPAFILAVIEE